MVFDELVSTMPIHTLVKIAKFRRIPQRVREAVPQTHCQSAMYVISLGVRGEDPEKMTAIYFPEEDFLVNRLSYPATFLGRKRPGRSRRYRVPPSRNHLPCK